MKTLWLQIQIMHTHTKTHHCTQHPPTHTNKRRRAHSSSLHSSTLVNTTSEKGGKIKREDFRRYRTRSNRKTTDLSTRAKRRRASLLNHLWTTSPRASGPRGRGCRVGGRWAVCALPVNSQKNFPLPATFHQNLCFQLSSVVAFGTFQQFKFSAQNKAEQNKARPRRRERAPRQHRT